MTRLRFIQRGILNDHRSVWVSVCWSVLIVSAATALRIALEPWVNGVPFLTYFPAVLFAGLLLGWRWGALATAASAAAANFILVAPEWAWALRPNDLVGTAAFVISAALIIMTADALRGALRELDSQAKREGALNAELQHRVKNNLAVVQGLARQTARSARDTAEFYEAFRGRLIALAEAHNVLSSGRWEECYLPHLAEAAMEPFQIVRKVELSGPRCALPTISCVPLVLALHELATNAVKYGALSSPNGRVSVTWEVHQGRLHLRWREADGPAVAKPSRQGLGTRLLNRQSGLDAVNLQFEPQGVVCDIVINGAEAHLPG